MNEKPKMTDKEKPRVRLGEQATLISEAFVTDGEQVNAAHLEQAVTSLLQGKAQLEDRVESLLKAPEAISKSMIQKEFDQLHLELSGQSERQHIETVNMFNAMRHLIGLVATDLADEETEEAIKEVNMWLDLAIKPIAETRAEASKKRIGDGRIPEEEDITQTTMNHAEVGQPMREQEPDMFQERDMEMGR